MAKTPPSRSYRLFSGLRCSAWAYASPTPAKATGAAVSASPATALRLVMDVDEGCAISQLLSDGARRLGRFCVGDVRGCGSLGVFWRAARWPHLNARVAQHGGADEQHDSPAEVPVPH